MKIKVKTIWGAGLVSVASKYVEQALKLNEGLEIECNGATRSVSFEKLKEKKPREAKFNDKFGRAREYSLYDFFWNDLK